MDETGCQIINGRKVMRCVMVNTDRHDECYTSRDDSCTANSSDCIYRATFSQHLM